MKDRVLVIGTIGHVDHGKTSLTAAITKVLADNPGQLVYSAKDFETNIYAGLSQRQAEEEMVFGEHFNRKQRRAMRRRK